MIIDLIYFILWCIVLVISGTFLVKSLSKISQFLKITEYSAAFIIMAIATSLPELFVGISSALSKNTALILGNIIGANILDITLIVGIFALVGRGIGIKNKRIKKDVFYMVGIVILPLILFLIGNSISKIDGMILLAAFIFYSSRLLKRTKKFEKEYETKKKIKRIEGIIYSFVFIASLVLLFLSADKIIKYASIISLELALSPILIGLFLISFGTTLPELVFGTRAIMLRHPSMTIGNQIGTIIVNSTLVLGVSAIIYPISAQFQLFLISASFMVLVAFLFAAFINSGKKIDITEGISLILLYIFFLMLEIYSAFKLI